jgi:hypothetical protein
LRISDSIGSFIKETNRDRGRAVQRDHYPILPGMGGVDPLAVDPREPRRRLRQGDLHEGLKILAQKSSPPGPWEASDEPGAPA